MARIGVVHHDLMKRGGAEAVCVNAIEALQPDHEVTLVTARDPDFAELERFYDADLAGTPVRLRPSFEALTGPLVDAVDALVGFRFFVLSESLLFRYARTIEDEFDLMISTHDDCCFDGPAVLYLNFPRYGLLQAGGRSALPEYGEVEDSLLRMLYYDACFALGGLRKDCIASGTLLTNSSWTAEIVERVYDVEPSVVHPPVDAGTFDDVPWEEREDGFVTIGRLSEDKNVLRNIEILNRLVERGHDVHMHVVGPRGEGRYFEAITDAAAEHDFVELEGSLDRGELERLITDHKFGLHGKENEHFGMVVAEMAAGGAIPFVPNGGGQRDIVNGRSEQLYETVDEAVEKIDRVLSSPGLQAELRREAASVRERFGRERFRTEIRNVVREALE